VSNRILGIGVVVAAFVASAAVTAFVMREPGPVPSTSLAGPQPESPMTPGAPVSRSYEAEVVAPVSVAPAMVRRAPRPPAPRPMPEPVSPVVEITPASAPPQVIDPPKADAPKVDAPKYVPDSTPAPAPQVATPLATQEPEFVEVTVERHSVIGIRLDYAVSSRTAKVEDRISATVSRNVTVDGRVAIPEGARLEGTITSVDRGGKFRERPRLGLQFDTMILTDGTRMSIRTDAIIREGDSPSADAAVKVGAGTAAGAVIGSVLGGKKGAVIGGVTGAAAGTATVMSGDGNETALKSGAPLTVRLTDELIVLLRKQ
jgi:hypothetical protein